MLIPEKLIDAYVNATEEISPICELSYIKIYCKTSNGNDVMNTFMDEFEDAWSELCERFDDSDVSDELPLFGNVEENTVVIHIDGMTIKDEDDVDVLYDLTPLQNAIEKTKSKYKDISFEGFLITEYSDYHYGEIYMDEIMSNGKITNQTEIAYQSIGEFLSATLSETNDAIPEYLWAIYGDSANEIWEFLANECDEGEFKELFKCLCTYSKWVKNDIFEKLIEVISEQFEELADEFKVLNSKRLQGEPLTFDA